VIARVRAWRIGALCISLAVAPVLTACSDSPTQPAPIAQPPAPPSAAPPEPPPPPPPRLGVTKILAFGDSMTAGTTSPPLTLGFTLDAGLPRSYPFKLQTMTTARYKEQTIQVFNAGIAGNRASQDRDRFNRTLNESLPQVVLLMEGANDLNTPFRTGEGINDRIRFTVGSMEDLVKDAVGRQIPVLLATLPPQRPGGRNAGAATFLTRYNDALKVMAGLKGAEIVDVYAQMSLSDIGEDGLHPTEDGYQKLAQIWLDAIKARWETARAGLTSSAAAAEEHGAVDALRSVETPAASPLS
jgi:lysophospholipase L1-like esterase